MQGGTDRDRNRPTRHRIAAAIVAVVLAAALAVVTTSPAGADGTETLGPPSIPIFDANDLHLAGVGTQVQPATMTVEVPAGAAIGQVLLYWEGQSSSDANGDDTISVNGTSVTGTLIGGPTLFVTTVQGVQRWNSTYRADITGLGLITDGANALTITDMDFDVVNHGAGVVVLSNDPVSSNGVFLQDGSDTAFFDRPPPLDTTNPVTITFPAHTADRAARLALMAGSVAEDEPRPSEIIVTSGGQTVQIANQFSSNSGAQWDVIDDPITIPAGATEVTFQVLSNDPAVPPSGFLPASLVLVFGALVLSDPGTAAVGDRVFLDNNRNGIQDPGPGGGVRGIDVRLLDAGGNVVETTVTNPQGNYIFTGVLPGDYQVEFDAPPGFGFTDQDIGGDDAVDSDPDPATGITDLFTLAADQIDLTRDAGLVAGGATLGDFVYIDQNSNGVQDAGEPGVAGERVRLLDPAGNLLEETTTGVDGEYVFAGIDAGSYIVEFANATDRPFTTQDAGGDDAVDSDADPVTGRTGLIVLADGEVNLTVDAGFTPPGGVIGDYIWIDENQDGQQGPTEACIVGFPVRLYDATTGDLLGTEITDDECFYRFTGLPAGDYIIEIQDRLGFPGTVADVGDDRFDSDPEPVSGRTAVITLAANEVNLTIDGGLVPTGSGLGDRVWDDADSDGVQDPGEAGVPGITVNLFDAAGTLVGTDVTDDDGRYLFINLEPGDYVVEFADPPRPFSPLQTSGDDVTDSDADPATGRTRPITLGVNDVTIDVDAGLLPSTLSDGSGTGVIGDFVWKDTDRDGVQDSGEPGLGGITIRLFDSAGTEIASTVSAADGSYTFAGLAAGDYQIEVDVPADCGLTTADQTTDDLDSDIDPGTRRSPVVTLPDAGIITTLDIGFVVNIPQTGATSDGLALGGVMLVVTGLMALLVAAWLNARTRAGLTLG